MAWTQEKINELYVKIQKQAVMDEEFRNSLLADPNKVIQEMTEEKLPDGFKVKVVESDPAYNATFVIPDLLGEEMEEEDLEKVAGGFSILLVVSACAAAVGGGGCIGDACAAKLDK